MSKIEELRHQFPLLFDSILIKIPEKKQSPQQSILDLYHKKPAAALPPEQPHEIARRVEEGIRLDARVNKHTLVPNQLHPANRAGFIEEENAFDRLARAAAAYGTGSLERMNPEDPWS